MRKSAEERENSLARRRFAVRNCCEMHALVGGTDAQRSAVSDAPVVSVAERRVRVTNPLGLLEPIQELVGSEESVVIHCRAAG